MKKFDPLQVRRVLDGGTGYRFFLNFDFNETKSNGGLASVASAYLNMAVACILVGYDGAARQLLVHSFDWLTIAIREDERPPAYGAEGTEAERHLNLAMCNWLLNATHDIESLWKFVEHEDRFLINSKIGRDRTNVSLTLIGYVDAGAYRQALERFLDAGLPVPRSLDSIRNEGQMCYVICRHRLRQEYSEADVKTASKTFLKRSLNAWLVDGHFLRAAHWMKVAHWWEGNAGLSPKEAVLKCYEYLPDVASST